MFDLFESHKLIFLHNLPFQVAVLNVLAVGGNQHAIDIAPCMQAMSARGLEGMHLMICDAGLQ